MTTLVAGGLAYPEMIVKSGGPVTAPATAARRTRSIGAT
jgi:hypothetical protein